MLWLLLGELHTQPRPWKMAAFSHNTRQAAIWIFFNLDHFEQQNPCKQLFFYKISTGWLQETSSCLTIGVETTVDAAQVIAFSRSFSFSTRLGSYGLRSRSCKKNSLPEATHFRKVQMILHQLVLSVITRCQGGGGQHPPVYMKVTRSPAPSTGTRRWSCFQLQHQDSHQTQNEVSGCKTKKRY